MLDPEDDELQKALAQENTTQQKIDALAGTQNDSKPEMSNTSSLESMIKKWYASLQLVRQKIESEHYDSQDIPGDISVLENIEATVMQALLNYSKEPQGDLALMENIKRLYKQLLRVIAELKHKHLEEDSCISEKLVKDKQTMMGKLKNQEGVEQVVLYLFQNVRLLQRQLLQESKRRAELEVLLDVEVNELNKLLLAESQAREDLRYQLRQAMRVKNSVMGDLTLLRGYLEIALSKEELSNNVNDAQSTSDIREAQNEEINNLINLTLDIDFKLTSLDELAEFSNLELLQSPDAQTKMLEALTTQMLCEVETRNAIETKNETISSQLLQIETQIIEEKKLRKDLEHRILMAKKRTE